MTLKQSAVIRVLLRDASGGVSLLGGNEYRENVKNGV